MSKKIIFLAIVSAGIMFSCQKTTIQPNAETVVVEETPVWRGAGASSAEFDEDRNTGHQVLIEDVKIDVNLITDPNNDEDRNKKKKGNH